MQPTAEEKIIIELGEKAAHKIMGMIPQLPNGIPAYKGLLLQEVCWKLYNIHSSEAAIIAGVGSAKPIKDIERITNTYGGTADDWVKLSSKQERFDEGSLEPKKNIGIELHWYENIRTGQKVEAKPVIDNKPLGRKTK